MSDDYKIFPIGDAAITLELGNRIDLQLNRKALAIKEWFITHPFEGLRDIIVGYSNISILYDPLIVKSKYAATNRAFDFVRTQLEDAYAHSQIVETKEIDKTIDIPVCYDPDFGYDLEYVSQEKKLSIKEIIDLHVSKIYYVYMIGFLPGFSYLAELNEKLVIPRKPKPVPVVAGSVGIAGSQTGVYSLDCPGGWQIIGRTPLKLFDAALDPPAMLNAGDWVRFYEISKEEFAAW
ncbi:MAG TPA: 5-oxoprolinase subunit PxpB [Puia sp.]|nr:5-oxoprolinase subunit PxpB [Puia sp.]